MTDKPSLTAVFEHYDLKLIGHGVEMKGQCPLPEHDDTNPSASVNEDEGVWMCHACDEGGDAYTIIQKRESCDFKKAIEFGKHLDAGTVDAGRHSSSLLPRAGRSGRKDWTPPWRRI